MKKQVKYFDELLNGVDVVSASPNLHVKVSGIQLDSRKLSPGDCFVAIRGFNENGLKYIPDAIEKGAACLVFETRPEDTFPDLPLTVPWVLVKNARHVISRMAAAFYRGATQGLYAVGITGTNGKTTVMSLIQAIFSREVKTARIGTLGMACEGTSGKTGLTTPESIDIFKFLSEIRAQDCHHLVMEASSVALRLHRVDNIHFSQGIFTNFSGDHLDFHQTMERYLEAKLLLFKRLGMEDWAVINLDDPAAEIILEQVDCKYLTYGFSDNADVYPMKYRLTLGGIQATIKTPKGNISLRSPLIGRINLMNILAAVASAVIKGISFENISAAIEVFTAVKGRLDVVYKGKFSVLIDYAHTDNALESLLKSLRELVTGTLIVVFGAGGDRDKSKRPRMGSAACSHADVVVVTSDNPRNEDPRTIVADVVAGFPEGFSSFLVETDRKKAIKKAVDMAEEGDLVVVAGKGHEDYQIFKDKTIHFDDYEVVTDIVSKKRET